MADCTYCGQDLAVYDAVYVEREEDGGRENESAFYNDGCLSTWLNDTDATAGACCRIDT